MKSLMCVQLKYCGTVPRAMLRGSKDHVSIRIFKDPTKNGFWYPPLIMLGFLTRMRNSYAYVVFGARSAQFPDTLKTATKQSEETIVIPNTEFRPILVYSQQLLELRVTSFELAIFRVSVYTCIYVHIYIYGLLGSCPQAVRRVPWASRERLP